MGFPRSSSNASMIGKLRIPVQANIHPVTVLGIDLAHQAGGLFEGNVAEVRPTNSEVLLPNDLEATRFKKLGEQNVYLALCRETLSRSSQGRANSKH